MSRIRIVDRRAGKIVDADLLEDVSQEELAKAEESWQILRREARLTRPMKGARLDESVDWNWAVKRSLVSPKSVRVFGILHEGKIQGLMMLGVTPVPVRSGKGKMGEQALYVEYLESAPWNLAEYVGAQVRYATIGTMLLRCAMSASKDMGCAGRLALHSLPGLVPSMRRNISTIWGSTRKRATTTLN
jgi:hypothetical protein